LNVLATKRNWWELFEKKYLKGRYYIFFPSSLKKSKRFLNYISVYNTKNFNLFKNGDPTTNKIIQFFNKKHNLFLFIKKTIEDFVFSVIYFMKITFFLHMCVKLKADCFISFWDKSSIISQNIVIPAVLKKQF